MCILDVKMCFLDIAEGEGWSLFSCPFCSLYIFTGELRSLMLRDISEQFCWFYYFVVVVWDYPCLHLMIWEYLFLVFVGWGCEGVINSSLTVSHCSFCDNIFNIPSCPLFLFALTFCLILGAGVRVEGRCKGIENEWDRDLWCKLCIGQIKTNKQNKTTSHSLSCCLS